MQPWLRGRGPGSGTRRRSARSGAASRTRCRGSRRSPPSPSGSRTSGRSRLLRRLQYGLHTRERARVRAFAARRHRARARRARRRARRRPRLDRASHRGRRRVGRRGGRAARLGMARRALPRPARAPSARRPVAARAELGARRPARPEGAAGRVALLVLAGSACSSPARCPSSGRSGSPGWSRSAAPCSRSGAKPPRHASRASDSSRPSSSRLSNRPGETFEPVIARRIGSNAWRGFWPSRSARARSAASIRSVSHGSTRLERLRGRAARLRVGAVRADRLEEEAHAVGVQRELLELLLHERHASRARSPPARRSPARASQREQRRRVLVLRQRAQVDAVHPVELLVVERRRARDDALEREALDELGRRHDRGLVVVAPAEQREEVHQRGREVAVLAEGVDRHRAVALRELLAVRAVDVRHVRVDRQVGAERAQDVDLRRRVRDVVVAADHVRDPVEHVVDRRGEVVDRAAVGADDDRVGEVLVRELDPAAHRVVPRDRALVGHAEADRALVHRTPCPPRRAARRGGARRRSGRAGS